MGPFAIPTSICRSIVTNDSGLFLLMDITSLLPRLRPVIRAKNTSETANGLFDGMMRSEQSDSRQCHRPAGSAAECDGLEDPPVVRTIDNASRRAPGLSGIVQYKL